jgi:hypothetical protein
VANNYEQMTPESDLVMDGEDHAIWDELMTRVDEENEEADRNDGISYSVSEDSFYFYAEEILNLDDMHPEILEFIEKLIVKNKKPFLELGVALTCGKHRPGEFGGYSCRIYPGQGVVYPTVVWPGSPAV